MDTSLLFIALILCFQQAYLWVPAQTHEQMWGMKAQPSAVKRGFCWGVQHSQGSTLEPTSKDQLISWSSLE